MEFKYHVLIGAIVSYSITIIFNLEPLIGLTIFLASVLIDIDHYFWYAFETRDLNPFHAIGWYLRSEKKNRKLSKREKEEYKIPVFIFHNWICWATLLVLGIFTNRIFLLILIGFAIHIIPDLIYLKRRGLSIQRKISISYALKRNKNKKSLTGL